ncbi:hypothetical protein [Blautia sp.]|uniref:hypothetical protein n=1 Tax=Blautia sp. TaxID=1955243 RepID=UPI0025901577|nr:hypothetical protein [Blautia sp.]
MNVKEFFQRYKIACIGSLGMVPVLLAIGISINLPETEKTEEIKVAEKTVETKEETKKTEKLSSFVKGMKDLYVEQNAKDVDWLKGVTYDKQKVKEVTADGKAVKLDKPGAYDLVYKITGKDNAKEEKSVKVTVVDSKKSQELANNGKEVLLSKNEVKKAEKEADKKTEEKKETAVASAKDKAAEDKKEDKKAEEPKPEQQNQAPAGDNAGAAPDTGNASQPSGGNESSGGGNGGAAAPQPSQPAPEQPSTPEQKPSEPSKPAEPEKQWHEPVYDKVWVVDKAAWDETIEEPVYGMVPHWFCNTCQEDITADPEGHVDETMHAGYYSDWRKEPTGTTTKVIHHEEEGHFEKKLIKEGYWG